MEQLTLHLMDTEIYVGVKYKENVEWIPVVKDWFTHVANEWSRFKTNNLLATINALPIGKSLRIPPPLFECLLVGHYYYEHTDGLFSPYLKKQMEQLGYHITFKMIEKVPKEIDSISSIQFAPCLHFKADYTIEKIADTEIDLGGFAKGYAVEYASKLLQNLGEMEYGIVDGGGDMVIWSNTDKVWKIGISDPYMPAENLEVLLLKNAAIATSSTLKRSWANGEKNHLINGQTGRIATSEVLQTTVIAPTLIEAEVTAKMCFFQSSSTWFNERFPTCKRYIVTTQTRGWQL